MPVQIPYSDTLGSLRSNLKCTTTMGNQYCGVLCARSRSTRVGRIFESRLFCGHWVHANKALESTLKRHGYYCRSRKASRANRSRSCTSCARSKLRCDNRRPACSRCTTRAIECHYLAETPKSKSLAIQHRKDAPTEWRRDSSWVPGPTSVVPEELCPSRGPVFDSALLVPDPELADLGWDSLDWDGSEIDLPDFLDAEKIDHSSSWQSVSVRHPGPPTDRWVQMQQEMPSPTISVPILRSLIPRPKLKPGEQRVANLILQTLNSYPLMMIRHNTLPPFIHPRSLSADAENEHMEPLTNCINLVHMINGGFQGSRKLFWKMVRLECEHLCEEVRRIALRPRWVQKEVAETNRRSSIRSCISGHCLLACKGSPFTSSSG